MKRALLSPLPLLLAATASAALPPQEASTLYRHMLEVNAQWQTMDPSLADDATPVHFSTEAQRIARHLHMVAGRLRMHGPAGMSPGALAQRAFLLNKLDAYADRGMFPQNEVLPYRNPVFIDPYGTACAVGQLMIESGHRALAEDISHTMNLAYVKEMHRTDVLAWAMQHGFTEEELAWIQPGYPPSTPWGALGGGTNGPVRVMLNLPDGTVLVAGAFSEAGGTAVTNVARWDGSSFTALGTGVPGDITCAAAMGQDIYLGGSSIGGINDLAHWDGSQWSFSTVFQGKYAQIFALHVMNGTLYAAGQSQGFAGPDDHVARQAGPVWLDLPGKFNAPIRCLNERDGQLVAGGEFTSVNTDGNTIVTEHVATCDAGGWGPLGGGLDGPVLALLNEQGTLYAGGAMYGNASPVYGLARMAAGASSWEPLMPNLGNYVAISPGTTQVRALIGNQGNIYVGGDFAMTMGTTVGAHLARFTGTADGFEPLAMFNQPVNVLAANPFLSDAAGLYAGGAFTMNVGDSIPYLAETAFTSGIPEATEAGGLAVHPNPASDRLTVSVARAFNGPAEVAVLDPQGRTVLKRPLNTTRAELDVARLAAGAYTVVVAGEGRRLAVPFIKR